MTTVETKRVQIKVNGESRTIPADASLLEVLAHLGIDSGRVAVEKDRCIVRKQDWASTIVQPDSQLEIVQFVGGG